MTDHHDVSDWLWTQLRTSTDVRLGVQGANGTTTTAGVTSQAATDAYDFVPTGPIADSDRCHRVCVTDGELQHTVWQRIRVAIEGEADAELVVDLPVTDAEPPPEGQLFVARSDVVGLLDHSGVSPLPADRVAGLSAQKHRLRQFLRRETSKASGPNRDGILLAGPPGTGKTELVIETCAELFGGLPVTVSGAELREACHSESSGLLEERFRAAQERTPPLLYIDAIDAIGGGDETPVDSTQRDLVATLAALLDGIEAKRAGTPAVVASTNRLEAVDPALRRAGRLGNRPIEFTTPGPSQRKAIFHQYFEQLRVGDRVRLDANLETAVTDPCDSHLLDRFAETTAGYTGADIEDVVTAAVGERAAESDRIVPILDAATIRRQIRSREIQPEGPSLTDTVCEAPDNRTVEIDGDGHVVRFREPVDRATLHAIGAAWQQRHPDYEFRLRTVQVSDLLGSTPADTRTRVRTVFDHDAERRLCLQLEGLASVARARDRTPIAAAALETIHERLLRWDEANVLVYRQNGDGDPIIAAETLDVTQEVSQWESVQVSELATRCWDAIDPQDTELTVVEEFTIEGDRTHLQLLFENLFRNRIEQAESPSSVRVGPLTPLHVSTRVEDADPQGFYVEADGPGLSDESNGVFESGETDPENGEFGLSMVKKAVDAHDWTISATDKDPGGVRFEIDTS